MRRCAVSLAFAALIVAVGGCHHGSPATTPIALPTLPAGGAIKDSLLYAAVKARLAGSDIDAATHVSVVVHGGVVTLRGPVNDAAIKAKFVKAVAGMRAVRSVDDQLHVGRVVSLLETVHNASLVAAVTSALTEQTGINVTGIRVRADRGTVTLAGSAPTAAIRTTLLAAAKHTPGVRNVVDKIAVK
jgi:osmotically-inducible protein OsmY